MREWLASALLLRRTSGNRARGRSGGSWSQLRLWVGGSCVLVADTPDVVAVRDSKNPAMAALRFTRSRMDAFVRHYARENNNMTQCCCSWPGSHLHGAGPVRCPQGAARVVGKS
ncbi:DUF397 domain-containing protein [Nocardiopsis sp. YSL2]|uniref:DUF397 domain-containing protein n=1 Tax=Nocardiopsis sp. YSL2 TaxID=2939492 RepID=UPI0026F470BA|nr:DUF397 domain-containing protein [Nocardiopsis sp. YSL2]